MDEHIEREAAIKMMRGSAIAKYPLSFSIGILAAADELQKMPAADVAPVVHGRWIYFGGNHYTRISQCTNCCAKYDFRSNYCPNCGAKMRGGKDYD